MRCRSAFASGSNAISAASPACSDVVGTTRTSFDEWSAACSAAMITFLLFGSTTTSGAPAASIASTRSAVDGFIVSPPSTTCAPALSNSARLPAPEATATTAARLLARRDGVQQALLALMRLLVHVRDLDAADRAARDAERQRATGVVGVHVHLQRRAVADDEQRVAELLELRLERVEIEVVAFDDEDRAVAVLRKLLMDRVDADLLLPLGRLGQRLAADGGCDAAHDLDEPAAPASTTPASRSTGSISRVAVTASSPAATISGSVAPRSAASAIRRTAVSIVPSTGFLTAR